MKSKEPIEILHNLLHKDLLSQATLAISEEKFKQLLTGLDKSYYTFQPRYEISFNKPLTAKRKYYYLLIEKASTQYLNSAMDEIAASSNVNERKYSVNASIKSIVKLLVDTSGYIETYGLNFENLQSKGLDKETSDKIYIIQALRLHLCRMYLEIQDNNLDYNKEEAFTYDELNEKYFSDEIPNSFIKDAPKVKSDNTSVKNNKPTEENKRTFVPQAKDFRENKKKSVVLAYSEIIKNSERFSRFEEALYSAGLINEECEFQDKHGQKQELAAVFHTLIQKGYFQKFKFPGKKPISSLEIRKFLDHRYQSNTDKQFRTWSNEPDKLADFVSKRYWIDKLPLS